MTMGNEFSDRIHNLDSQDEQKTRNLLGYRHHDSFEDQTESLVPIVILNQEFCIGVERKTLIKELQKGSSRAIA